MTTVLHYEVKLDSHHGLFEWRINGVKFTFVDHPRNTNGPQPDGDRPTRSGFGCALPITFFAAEELVREDARVLWHPQCHRKGRW